MSDEVCPVFGRSARSRSHRTRSADRFVPLRFLLPARLATHGVCDRDKGRPLTREGCLYMLLDIPPGHWLRVLDRTFSVARYSLEGKENPSFSPRWASARPLDDQPLDAAIG